MKTKKIPTERKLPEWMKTLDGIKGKFRRKPKKRSPSCCECDECDEV